MRCFESGNGDRRGSQMGGGHTLATPRADEAFEIIGSHVPATAHSRLSESHYLVRPGGPSSWE